MPPIQECRVCGEPVIWGLWPSGKKMPVDAEPCLSGTILMDDEGGLSRAQRGYVGPDLRTSHFDTCAGR